ncbi:MAG: hypothetical protein AB1439_07065 [candidate division FCPU426 bacterium]
MSLDRFLAQSHFSEHHRLAVSAPAEAVYAAARGLTLSELPAPIFWLLAVRSLPAWLLGKGRMLEGERNRPFLDYMVAGNFVILEENPGCEIVFGMAGEFWRLVPAVRKLEDAKAFLEFNAPGSVKVAANLLVQKQGNQSLLSTETRIWAVDQKSRRRFGLYWLAIRLGSGLIRRMWLHAIKKKAEKGSEANLPETAL